LYKPFNFEEKLLTRDKRIVFEKQYPGARSQEPGGTEPIFKDGIGRSIPWKFHRDACLTDPELKSFVKYLITSCAPY
jgi:hypothetical protein